MPRPPPTIPGLFFSTESMHSSSSSLHFVHVHDTGKHGNRVTYKTLFTNNTHVTLK